MEPIKLSILLPVRNETLNLQIMLKILKSVLEIPHEILVIFDNDQDPGIKVVKEFCIKNDDVKIVMNNLGRGVANALRAGVSNAAGEYILIFAADEVGPVLAIDDMLALADSGCTFISCTRYAHGGRRLGGSTIGHILSYVANILLKWCSSITLTDSTTGIKMFRRNDFNKLANDTHSIGWSVAFEMAVNAQILQMKLGEVPIISIDRLFGGKSSFKLIPWIIGYMRYFVLAIKKLPPWKKIEGMPVEVRIPINMEN